MTHQNMRDSGKAVLKGKLIVLKNLIEKKEKYQNSDFSSHLKN